MKAEVRSFLELLSRRAPLSLHHECVLVCSAAGLSLHLSAEDPALKGAGGMSWCLGGAGDEGTEGIYLGSEYQYVYLFPAVVTSTA